MGAAAAALNVGRAVLNRARRAGRHAVKQAQRAWRSAERRVESSVRAGRRAAAAGGALPVRAGKAAQRSRKRAERFREHVVEPWLEQRDVERELAALARGRDPIVVGPWLSEVGYEVLYWRPFLLWALDRYGIAPERLVAVSRGGVGHWYQGIAGRYVELLDLFTPEEFAARNEARRASGDQKQLRAADLDRDIVQRVAARLGVAQVRLCHPSLMFRLFRRFWFGDRSLDYFLNRVRFARMEPPPVAIADLPPRFAAVKFYTGPALPDSPECRRRLRELVARLSSEMPVVVLDTGLALDEHRDFLFDGLPGVTPLRQQLLPSNNLGVQTAVLARASLFVGTCGSLAWLGPMLGTPTVGVYADDRFLTPHLFVARHAYRRMRAASFTTLDLSALEALDSTMNGTAQAVTLGTSTQ